MRVLRVQYFLAYAVMGALLPYLPLYLESRGLTRQEVGQVMSVTGLAVILTPLLVTLLADLRVPSGWLLSIMHGLAVAATAGLMLVAGFWPILIVFFLFSLSFVPVPPVQDGLTFALMRQREAAGLPVVPFHRIRVWGTVGFIVPSLGLYVLIRAGESTSWALIVAAGICLAAMANALLLPRGTPPADGGRSGTASDQLPTLAAARAMLRPHVLGFAAAMWLVNLCAAGYYTYYPTYLTSEPIGIGYQWVGLISSIGVAVEIVFMLGCGWLLRKLGLRGLVIAGAMFMAARMLLLATFPTPVVAIGTQALHGIMVLILHVVPQVYLNRLAGDRFRSSMQGLFAMAVVGSGRVIGNLIAAPLAERSLTGMFAALAMLGAVAAAMLVLVFRENGRDQAA